MPGAKNGKTPFQRFEELARKVGSVPKRELDEQRQAKAKESKERS